MHDDLGAAGEELYSRVAVLLVAQSLIGWRGAVLVSGLMFSVLHLGKPGADGIWLMRPFGAVGSGDLDYGHLMNMAPPA